jgi:hypothetical protein
MITIGEPLAFVKHPEPPKPWTSRFKSWLRKLYGKWIR